MKLLRILLAASIVFSGTLISASPASAHDDVVSTMPGDGETVDAGKLTVTVAFAEDVLNLDNGKGLAINVTAPDGSTVSNGCVASAGVEISTDLDVDQAGDYKVAWQSVSTDGHATTGEFAFTVQNKHKYKSEGVPGCDRLVIAPAPTDNGAGDDANGGADQTGLIVGLVVALGLALFGGYYVRRRASKAKQED